MNIDNFVHVDFLQDDFKYGCRHSCGWRVDSPKCRLTGKSLEKKNNLKSNFLKIIKVIRFARPHSMLKQDLNKKSKARELKFLKI